MDTLPTIDTKKHARAQHNALERRRRDNIKDMYGALKDTIPGMSSERVYFYVRSSANIFLTL